jgi:hypothetical protein
MWGYYGSKSKVVGKYPKPNHNVIIEPFAGTAHYSLAYWDREIILIEKYEVICRLWKWLQRCGKSDVLGIRTLKYGESTDDFQWDCQEQKDLVGFLITGAPSMPKKRASKWKTLDRPNTQNYKLNLIAENLHKIKHWKIIQGDYTLSPDLEATWFIDPPYVVGGKYYRHGSKDLDYDYLANWCRGRKGQKIVCEGAEASWLPFTPLLTSRGNRKTYSEFIWTGDVVE